MKDQPSSDDRPENEEDDKEDVEERETTEELPEKAPRVDKSKVARDLLENKDFRKRVRATCVYLSKRRGEDLNDLEQKGYVKILEQIDNIENDEAIPGWLKKTLSNLLIDEDRKSKHGDKYINYQEREAFGKSLTGNLVEKKKINEIALKEFISKLSPKDRLLVELSSEGYKISEIINEYGLPRTATYRRWKKLLPSLAEFYNMHSRK